MSAIELYEQAIKLVPEELLYGKIPDDENKVILYKEYLEKDKTKKTMIDHINKLSNKYLESDNGLEAFVDLLTRGIGRKVKNAKEQVDYVNNFINSLGDSFITDVQYSENQIINTREMLLYKIKSMDDEFVVHYGGVSRTIEDVYKAIINNQYKRITKNDKVETVNYLYDKYLNYYLSQYDYLTEAELMHEKDVQYNNDTPYEFIEGLVPMMINSTEVKLIINGQEKIRTVDDMIYQTFKDRLHKINERKIEINNRVNEKPNELGEIKLEELDDKLSVTSTHIPTLNGDVLSEEERVALINTNNKLLSMPEDDYLRRQLYNIKDDINNALTINDLDNGINKYEEYKAKIDTNIEFNYLLLQIKESIDRKKMELIKIEGNKEELTDVTYGELSKLKRDLNSVPDGQSYNDLETRFYKISNDLVEKNISDNQVHSLVKDNKSDITKKNVINDLSLSYSYNNQNIQKLYFDIEEAKDRIRNNLRSRGFSKKNLEIAKLDANTKAIYQNTINEITTSFNERKISEDIYNKYMEYMEEIYNEYAYRVNIMEQENEEKVFGI